jgi:hypothetical protein
MVEIIRTYPKIRGSGDIEGCSGFAAAPIKIATSIFG